MKKVTLALMLILFSGIYAFSQSLPATIVQDPADAQTIILKVKNTSGALISGDIVGIVFSIRIPDQGASNPDITVTKLIPDGTGSYNVNDEPPYTDAGYHYYDNNITFSGNNPISVAAGAELNLYSITFSGAALPPTIELVAKQFTGVPNATGPNNSTEYSISVNGTDYGDGTDRFYDNGSGTVSNTPEISTVGIGAPLAISYSHIEAKKQGAASLITWGTATESDNQGFTVERSADGKSFEKIGNVDSKAEGGNSSSSLEYAFTDSKPLAGINYYRLKQTNTNGKYEYSKVVNVTFDNNAVIALYPNPARDYTTVKSNGIKSIMIYDVSGKSISLPVENNVSSAKINTSMLSNGIYNIRIESANGVTTQKVVVQH